MDDFSQCMLSNSRRAARAMTRRYDAYLRPYGMTATQLSLLGAIQQLPDRTIGELAEERGFDRTTLTRNLERLREMGLVNSRPAGAGNGRISEVSQKGEALIAEMLPQWRQAQAETAAALGVSEFAQAIATLKRLAQL